MKVRKVKNYLLGFLMAFVVIFISCGDKLEASIAVISIDVKGNYIADGTSSQMTAIVTPDNATNPVVHWTVSDNTVAEIDESGLLTAILNGKVTVIATATDGSGVQGQKLIGISGVYEPPVLVTSITIHGTDVTEGKSQKYTANVLPINAANQKVTWSVSDEEYAEIDSVGYLTPLKNGEITVYATAKDESAVKGELSLNISGVDENIIGIVVSTSSELTTVIANAVPGDKIYLRGGNYPFGSTVRLTKNGTSDNMISLLAYPTDSERPVLDFSAMNENSGNRGVSLSGNYWHIKGLDIYKAGDNGMNISGSNNIIEFCAFYENADTGLQIGGGGANNTIINCDSYYNADSNVENADGFAAKLDCGSGNKFIGCRAWNNLDDGWDGYLRGADNVDTFYENCWAIRNGYLKSGAVGGGDGNGFKTGGSDGKDLKHNAKYTNCIAAGNVVDGFDHNSNRGNVTMLNCGAYANGRNINFGSSNIANSLQIKNSVTLGGIKEDSYLATTTDLTNNSWQNGLTANSSDYLSLNIDLLLSPRKADGSLPDVDFMKLVDGSDLIDQGVEVGLPFNGSAPDVGAFEFE